MKKYFVYAHRRADDQIFYIGYGQNSRAFSLTPRNEKWASIVDLEDHISISILHSTDSLHEACQVESALIRALRPEANMKLSSGKPVFMPEGVVMLQHIEAGGRFRFWAANRSSNSTWTKTESGLCRSDCGDDTSHNFHGNAWVVPVEDHMS